MRHAKITEAELIAVAEGSAPRALAELVQRAAAENADLARNLALWQVTLAVTHDERDNARACADRIARRIKLKLQYAESARPPAATPTPTFAFSDWFRRPAVAAVAVGLIAAAGALLFNPAPPASTGPSLPAPIQVAYQPPAPQPAHAIADLVDEIRQAQSGAVIRVAAGKIEENIRITKPLRLERATP